MADITITPAGAAFDPTDTVTSTRLNEARNPTAALDAGTIVNADVSATADILGSKLADATVTKAKIENISAPLRVLGRTTAGAGVAEEVTINDEGDMANASAITLATDESIKAYVDEYAMKYSGVTASDLQTSGLSTYRDLDLSSTVGANRALVILEIEGSSVGSSLFFRTKGSTVRPVVTQTLPGWGSSGGYSLGANNGFNCVVITNASGVLEYAGSSTATGIGYTVQAYQKLT